MTFDRRMRLELKKLMDERRIHVQNVKEGDQSIIIIKVYPQKEQDENEGRTKPTSFKSVKVLVRTASS